MESIGLTKQFSELTAQFQRRLEARYNDEIEKATNKEYAKTYFKHVLFERNAKIPYNTVFFQELIFHFIHFSKLDDLNAIEKTISFLPAICEKSRIAHGQATDVLFLGTEIQESELPVMYQNLIFDNVCTLPQLAELEEGASRTDEAGAIQLLALHEATQRLLEVREQEATEDPQKVLPQRTHQFTHSQQVLFALYLFKMAGIEPRVNADISACAEILHGITGISFNSIANSDLYKKFLKPLDNSSPKKTIQDLEFVRSYFAKLDRPDILSVINRDIHNLKNS